MSGPDRPRDTEVLSPASVATGRTVFAEELTRCLSSLSPTATEVDALVLLRGPVARSTTAALLPGSATATRDLVADLVVAWVDALGPVISALDPPRRWSRVRRAEQRAWRALVAALGDTGCPDPQVTATALAAGVQVPIAAGAWCLVVLAGDPSLQQRLRGDHELALPLTWEILRLFPPTWLLPRMTTREVTLAGMQLPPYTPVVVSPVALGRLDDLVPGADLDRIEPARWTSGEVRPGAWLPFGAGPHACPGRNLGLAQLTELARQATGLELEALAPLGADAGRGLSPSPSRILVRRPPSDA